MIEKREMSRFLFDLERRCTDLCYTIKLAYDGKITKEYLMGFWYPTPDEVKQIHKEDYYWNFFHGLTILGISEKEYVISKSSTNIKRQIAYELLKLDDGDYYNENILGEVAWYFADLCEKCIKPSNIRGLYWRHPFGHKKKVHKSLRQNQYLIESGINLQNGAEIESFVDSFCNKLRGGMSLKEYTQCLHVLTCLGVAKNSKKLPEISSETNVMYNIAYKLWAFDTSQKNWKIIEQIVCLSSKLKNK